MIKKIDDLNFYELLEINPRASSQEVHKAYERVRRIYEPNSIALYSLFTAEETAKIRQKIEDAYRTLAYDDNRRRYDRMLKEQEETPEPEPLVPAPRYERHYQPVRPAPAPQTHEDDEPIPVEPLEAHEDQPAPAPVEPVRPAPAPRTEVVEFTGMAIRVLREQAGLSIRNVADTTKIGSRYLEYIELENFAKLPPRAYLRGFLLQYAKLLGVDPERLAGDYLKRYEAASQKTK
ncbi:MAG TPA: helix-turn-helix domain-containing protein [Nitrospirota bacterium]|nr:helix-turn-helix domain-containing protein [Nitrospirota bacterium]